MATHSSVLAWRIPGTGEPGGLPSMGSHRVGHDWSDLAAVAAVRPQRVQSVSPQWIYSILNRWVDMDLFLSKNRRNWRTCNLIQKLGLSKLGFSWMSTLRCLAIVFWIPRLQFFSIFSASAMLRVKMIRGKINTQNVSHWVVHVAPHQCTCLNFLLLCSFSFQWDLQEETPDTLVTIPVTLELNLWWKDRKTKKWLFFF